VPGGEARDERGVKYIKAPMRIDSYMALSIKDPEADRLARELAEKTGETLTEAVVKSLRERVAREKARSSPARLAEALGEIGRRCATLPAIDERSPEEIIGYDEDGLPS
jgi:antitoxin VapB